MERNNLFEVSGYFMIFIKALFLCCRCSVNEPLFIIKSIHSGLRAFIYTRKIESLKRLDFDGFALGLLVELTFEVFDAIHVVKRTSLDLSLIITETCIVSRRRTN